MTPLALLDCQIFVGAADFTGVSNQVSLDLKAEELVRTTFASNGWNERQGGLDDSDAKVSGFMVTPGPDDAIFGLLSQAHSPATIVQSLTNPVAYVFEAVASEYQVLGAVGDQSPYAGEMMGSSTLGVARGTLLLPKGTMANATGADFTLPAATKRVLVAVHVFSGAGSVTLTVQSATSSGYSGPTTVATFTGLALGGSQLLDVEGASANTHYRCNVSSTSGTLVAALAIGVV